MIRLPCGLKMGRIGLMPRSSNAGGRPTAQESCSVRTELLVCSGPRAQPRDRAADGLVDDVVDNSPEQDVASNSVRTELASELFHADRRKYLTGLLNAAGRDCRLSPRCVSQASRRRAAAPVEAETVRAQFKWAIGCVVER